MSDPIPEQTETPTRGLLPASHVKSRMIASAGFGAVIAAGMANALSGGSPKGRLPENDKLLGLQPTPAKPPVSRKDAHRKAKQKAQRQARKAMRRASRA